MGELCGDNRFKMIEAAKKRLVESTNIESSPDEMKCIDSFLFRAWQMGWLNCAELPIKNLRSDYDRMRSALVAVKDAFQTDIIWAPGESPTYEAVEKVRMVYKAVIDALGITEEDDNEYFAQGKAALQAALGWTDEQVEAVLDASVI